MGCIGGSKCPTEDDLRCCLSSDEWETYRMREAHRNRAKRMRDARQNRAIASLKRKGKKTRLIDRFLKYAWNYDYEDIKYLEQSEEICVYEFYSKTATAKGRFEYIANNIQKHFNASLFKGYARIAILYEIPETPPVHLNDIKPLSDYLYTIMPPVGTRIRSHFGFFPSQVSDDVHLIIVCSR